MPSRKRPPRPRGFGYVLLGLAVLLCGLLARSAAPVARQPAATVTARPEAVDLPPMVTLPPATEAPEVAGANTPAPTAQVASTPILLGEDSGIWFMDVTAAPTATQTLAPSLETARPVPTEAPESRNDAPPVETPAPEPTRTPATLTMSVSTPTPAPTPTYQYATDTLRVEISRKEGRNIVYFAAEIWLTDARQLKSAFSSDRFDGATEPVGDIAVRNNAIVAINGDFATFNNGGIIIRNGSLYRANRSTRHMLVVDQNGDFIPYIDPPNDAKAAGDEMLSQGVWQTMVFGPVLVADGAAVPLPDSFFINTSGALEPRTAIAQLGPLHYLILVVDGRQDGYSQGVSLEKLQEMFLEYGAVTAFNLDGGGSTTMCFQGNVINRPANGGQRHVPDIIYVGE